jgi:hypothetical protein
MKKNLGKMPSLQQLIAELEVFINISLNEDELDFGAWVKRVARDIPPTCHERMGCDEVSCPAYKSECGRCWLLAGTLCGEEVQARFADKFRSCTECVHFKEFVGADPVVKLREYLLVLIHSLLLRKQELRRAMTEVKTLGGLLPICSHCKNIRDDKGYWNRIDSYIAENSEVIFSHGLCPDCLQEHYQEYAEEVFAFLARERPAKGRA